MTTQGEQIMALLMQQPMTVGELVEKTGWTQKTVSARLYGLKGKVAKADDGRYQVVPKTPDPPGGITPPSPRATLSADQAKFRSMLDDCGVKQAQDTITETFFAGDPEDLDHLVAVLEDARAYVPPLQKRMIVRYWASFRQREMPAGLEARLAGGVTEKEGEDGGGRFMDDIGWKIEKDRDGEWVARPGGELKTYKEALRWAGTMNAARSSAGDDGGDEEEEGAPAGKRRRRGGGRDPFMALLIERAFPDPNKADPRDDEIKKLRERVEEMDKAQQEDRMDRLESMIAGLANRDPLAEFAQLQERYAVLAPSRGDGTTSPTVTLIQDQTNKLDKNVNRVVGLIERLAIRGKGE
ncbi:MAG: ArsR family transcriptional regulator, partial [Chloroflexota bacterium]|nr:ArsR family transcriptional regulator [Chloroflexota bacterium]